MIAPAGPTPLEPGTEAPDFSLTFRPRTAPVKLADYRGKQPVVLLFFPVAFSAVILPVRTGIFAIA